MDATQQNSDQLKVAISQMAPVWLNKEKTLQKIIAQVEQAGKEGCQLVVFGETLLPGYPFWVELTDGARFESTVQKEIYAHYLDQAVQPESGDLAPLCEAAVKYKMAVYVGCVEKAADRGGHSVYCSLVYISQEGRVASVHRKLVPTYEERLVWSNGDGHGLTVHPLGAFTVGGLNCWENWMPLSRAALYGQGENLHVAVWPGNARNTVDITRHIARESRSFVISAAGLMRREAIPVSTPYYEEIIKNCPEVLADGGSCLAGPNGEWIIEPVTDREVLLIATIDHKEVRRERQNFDPSGHYSRPDVTQLKVNRKRQSMIDFDE
jgi:nitrilase